MKNISTKTILKRISASVQRLSLTFFIIIVASGLMYSVIVLSGIIQNPSTTDSQASDTNNTSLLDQKTINRISGLKSSKDNSISPILPSGRINPFSG